jgi:hypothetical protein
MKPQQLAVATLQISQLKAALGLPKDVEIESIRMGDEKFGEFHLLLSGPGLPVDHCREGDLIRTVKLRPENLDGKVVHGVSL